MAQYSTLAKKRSSRKDEPSKATSWVRRWLDASRPPKKRDADPPVCVRTEKRKPRPQSTPTHERGRRSHFHTPLLEVHLRCGRFLCRGRTLGRRRPALHQDSAEALLSLGGGNIVRIHQRTLARDVGSGPLPGDRTHPG